MIKSFAAKLSSVLLGSATLIAIGLSSVAANAQNRSLYTPIPFPTGSQISDRLTEKDIPTGQGGFARDYIVTLKAGDQIAIDLNSDEFDTIVLLLDTDGSTVAENDDGPDGSTNSLLFTRIAKSGNYIIRVRAFGETAGGTYTLKITRLKPA